MLTRRDLLQSVPLTLTASVFPRAARSYDGGQIYRKGNPTELSEQYPAYPPELIRMFVTVSHFDLNKLKDLIGPHPHLVKSAWDWGFGDWETPLGAACHMGRQDIAQFLLSKGATPSLFSWVLFGDLPMVKLIVERQAGIQRVAGPHSISLVGHARTGGKQSEAVLEYLFSLKDADIPKPIDLTEEERAGICGSYRFGAGPSQVVEVTDDISSYLKNSMYTYAPQLNWKRQGTMERPLFHVGKRVFYPAGSPSIQIRFEKHADAIMTISDGEIVLSGSREPSL